VERAPSEVRASTNAALACLRQRIDQGLDAELDAMVLGTEGEQRRFVFRALSEGEFELVGEVGDRWYYSGPCADVDWGSGIPLPSNCTQDTVDL
jgi:hypothetical protein